MTKQLPAAIAAMLVLSSLPMLAQTRTPATPIKKAARKRTETQVERTLRELREQMQAQQAEIDQLKRQLAERDQTMSAASRNADAANASAASALSQAQSALTAIQSNHQEMQTLSSSISNLKVADAELAQTISATEKRIDTAQESPSAMHYKGITITPVAYFAFETVWRQRSLNSDINTPFNLTPYMGAGQAHTSELNFSGRQSRIGGLFEGNTGPFRLSGYVEADFLSSGVTSNGNESNSYTLRQRQIWGRAATVSGFAVTGGQMWSLVTETSKSVDNGTENPPMTVDAQYHVGFSWARQAALRLQQRAGNGLTLAGAIEEAQTIYSATNANQNFFLGNAGSGPGLYNETANYSSNVAPDVIVKAAWDPGVGHYEIGGILRWFRDRYYPGQTNAVPTAAGAENDTKTGGGFFANARVPVTRYLDLGAHLMGGTGLGRYGSSTLPDVTVHPDGTLAPIKSWQGLYSMEAHPTPKLDLFGYAGAEYAQRTVYLSTLGSSAGKLIGYAPPTSSNAGCNIQTLPTGTGNGLAGAPPYNPGTPANCLGATRVVIEGTAGFTYRVYSNPKYGRLQYQGFYSYLTREAWTGIGGSPKATNSMVFTGMRYYIP